MADREDTQDTALPEVNAQAREGAPRRPAAAGQIGGRSGPPASQPSRGFTGNDWQERKTRFIEAAAKTGSPDAFVGLLGAWRDMEKSKVSGHIKNALTLSQMGRPNAAATQLEAVGSFISPGTRGVVEPGPEGSFVVRNYDESGNQVGGYALKPEQIAEIALAHQSSESFLDFKSTDRARRERTAMQADKTRAYIRNEQANARKADLEARQAMLDFSIAKRTAGSEVAEAEANAENAALEVEETRANLDEKEQTRVEGIVQDFINFADESYEINKQARDELVAGSGFDPEGPQPDQDTPDLQALAAMQPFKTLDDSGNVVPDPKARDMFSDVVSSLVRSNDAGNASDQQIGAAAMSMMTQLESNFRFFGGQPGSDKPQGVRINGTDYRLTPRDRARLEAKMVGARRAMLGSLWENMDAEEKSMVEGKEEFINLFMKADDDGNVRGFSTASAAEAMKRMREVVDDRQEQERRATHPLIPGGIPDFPGTTSTEGQTSIRRSRRTTPEGATALEEALTPVPDSERSERSLRRQGRRGTGANSGRSATQGSTEPSDQESALPVVGDSPPPPSPAGPQTSRRQQTSSQPRPPSSSPASRRQPPSQAGQIPPEVQAQIEQMPPAVKNLLDQMAGAGTRERAREIGKQVYLTAQEAGINTDQMFPVVAEILKQVISRTRR